MTQLVQPIAPVKKHSTRPFFIGLMVMIVLGAFVAYMIRSINQREQLQARISGLQDELNKKTTDDKVRSRSDNVSLSDNRPPAVTTRTEPASPQTTPLTWANSPSKPTEMHQVEKGETLFAIGQKYTIEWTSIVKANGLANENLIKAGDILIIPSVDAKSGINQVDFTVDSEKAKILQAQAPSTSPWRIDPIEVAKREASGVYGLTIDDAWVLGNKESDKGQATVRVAHGDTRYEVTLTQPIDKGEQGIWAVTTVKPVSK